MIRLSLLAKRFLPINAVNRIGVRSFAAVGNAATVKDLRTQSGAPIMKCREALTACHGDLTEALEWLRKEGLAKAEKRATLDCPAERRVLVHISQNDLNATASPAATAVVLSCETDFTANSPIFKALHAGILDTFRSSGVDEMDKTRFVHWPVHEQLRSHVVGEAIAELSSLVGERISLEKAVNFGIHEEHLVSAIGAYVHNERIGAIVSLAGTGVTSALARLIARQVVATSPATDEELMQGELLGGADDGECTKTVEEVLRSVNGTIVKIEQLAF